MTDFFKKITSSDIRNVLALVTTLGCFILLYLMLIKEIPVGNKDVLNVAIGFVFGSALTGVYGYYFGASKGITPADKEGKE
jgi:hypothetical protein